MMKPLQIAVLLPGAMIAATAAETPFPTATGDSPMPARAEVAQLFATRSHAVPGASQYGWFSVRKLETEGGISGSEPDPELFDHAGLETWWNHFRQAHGGGG